MPRRYFNWKLAVVLVIGLVVLGVMAFGLRKWQRNRMAYGALEKGNEAYDKCLWEEAAKNLGRYVAVVRDDVQALLKYADAQLNIRPLKQNNIKQAIGAYRAVLRIDNTNSEAASKLIEIYLQMRVFGEAELIATRALQANQLPKLKVMLAIALSNQRKFEEAEMQLKAVIKEHPEQILAYEALGQLIEQRPRDFQQTAQLWFDRAVKNNPSLAEAYIVRAAYHLRQTDIPKTLADLEKAEQKDLSDSYIRLRLAREFINANALDKARKHLEIIQTAEPDNLLLWQTWAQLALKSGSKTEMLEVAQNGLKELASQPWDFIPVAAELYVRSGEFDKAGECILKLHQKDAVPATTTFLEGLLADSKGNGYEAVRCWYKAMQLRPGSARVQLALASTLSRLGDKQSAVKQLRSLVSEQPNLINGRLNLARLLTETGNWAEATEHARMAMQISPRSLEAALLYIQAQMWLFAENQTDKNSHVWQDIENRLATLEQASGGALPVKISRLRLAILRSQFDKARQLLSDLKDSHQSQMEVDMAEVELLIAQDKTDQAIQKLYDVIDKFPASIGPLKYLAALLTTKARESECEDVIKNTLVRTEQPDDKRELALLLAEFYSRSNEQEKCYQTLNSLAGEFQNDVLIIRNLLKCKQLTKDPDRAQQLIDNIRTIEGENGWQWRYEQAKIWFAQDNFKDRYPQIVALLKENLLASPDDQASRTLLAASYSKADRSQLAISTYNEALNRSPRDIRIMVPAIAALYKANEYDRADEILRRAANQKLFHPELKRLELQSHLRRGRLGSASDILEDLLANDPDNQSVCLALALLKMRQNRFSKADELLSRLKARDPSSLPVTVAQIKLNVRQNKSVEALSLCDEVINKLNDASAYILRARTYAMLGQTGNAKKDFEHATIVEPDSATAWVAKSDFYRSIGHHDKALAAIQKAMSLEQDNIGIEKRAASLFLTSTDYNMVRRGKAILDKAMTSNPDNTELQMLKVHSLLAETTAPDIEQARSILQKITQEQPKVSQAWLLLGEIALMRGQSAKTLDIALRGLVHRPNDKSLLLLKARSEAARSPALAVPTLKALYELDPNDTDVISHLADTYLAADQPQKAITLLKTKLASRSNTVDERKITIALAVALHKSGNKQDAQKQFDSLLNAAPDDPAPLLAQARLLKDDQLWNRLNDKVDGWCQNHPEDTHTPVFIANDLATSESNQAKKIAEDLLRRALNRAPNSLPAMKTLAMLLQMTERSTQAAALYQKILKLDPDDVVAINNLAWILCEEQGKYKQALALAQDGLKKAPGYIDLIDTRGVAYYRLGRLDEAARDLNRCVELYPVDTPAAVASYFHLGEVLAELEQKNKAVESLKKALELNIKVGGLSNADLEKAQRLLEKLSEGGV